MAPARIALIIFASAAGRRFQAVSPCENILKLVLPMAMISALSFLKGYPIEMLISFNRFFAGRWVTYV